MVRFSQAASVLLLALGTTAFVPSKLGNVGVRSSVSSPAVDSIESCDAVLSRTNGKVGKKLAWLCSIQVDESIYYAKEKSFAPS
jgi:hypothetical protein